MNRNKLALRTTLIGTLALAALAGMAFTACGGDDDTATNPTTAPQATTAAEATKPAASSAAQPTAATAAGAIKIGDNFFQPATANVKAGEKVTWTWGGGAPHAVVGKFDGKDVKSDTKTGSGTFEFTFTKAGTFDYQCGVHGPSMPGKITIQ